MNAGTRALFVAATLVVFGCSRASEPQEVVRPVLSIAVAPEIGSTVGFAGTIGARTESDLAFRILGRITSINVEVGDFVAKGDVVSTLDQDSFELAVTARRANLANARALLANATADEARQLTLFRHGNASQAAYDAMKQARETAKADVERAQAALAKATEQRSYAQLHADFDGVVTALAAEAGQTVAPGQMIVSVAQVRNREAIVDIPDQLMDGLEIGTLFDVTLQTFPSVTIEGSVREIAPQSDNMLRSRQIRIALANPPKDYFIGSTIMAARVQMTTPSIELPLSALVAKDELNAVWVVDPATSTVSLHPIEIATCDKNEFVVTAGLAPGTRVVTAGVHSLTANQKVRIVEDVRQ